MSMPNAEAHANFNPTHDQMPTVYRTSEVRLLTRVTAHHLQSTQGNHPMVPQLRHAETGSSNGQHSWKTPPYR